jgi:AcrR family transcriptional regulator
VKQEESRPRRLSRAEAKRRTRELLLESAARTFARRGFAGASVEEIAELAGFSVGALYSNFASKQQLFVELMSDRASTRIAQALEIVEHRHETDPLAAAGQMMAEAADEDQDFALLQAEFWLYAVRHPEALEAIWDRMNAPRETLRALIDAAMRRRGVAPDVPVESVTTLVLALFQGLAQQRRLDPERVPTELFGNALRWLFTGLQQR